MAKYNVATNMIRFGVLYKVIGGQSVTYNSVLYATGSTFRGVYNVNTFNYSGTGTQEVNELIELQGKSIEYEQNGEDVTTYFPNDPPIKLIGTDIEYVQSDADIYILENTTIKGFAIEFIDDHAHVTHIHKRKGFRASPNLRTKFLPLTGIVKLLPSDVSVDALAVQEISVIPDEGAIKIYFTVHAGGANNNIWLATATDIEDEWTIVGDVVGRGFGGAPANRQALGSHVFRHGGYIYCAATNGYGGGGAGEDRHIYLYRSTDGVTFTDLGKLLDKSLIPSGVGYGNIYINPTLVNGVYECLVESSLNSSIWTIHRLTSTNIESGWTYANACTSLQVATGGMYGGPQMIHHNGTWYTFYHYGTNSGNLPTVIGWAKSADLVTFQKKESPLFAIEAKPYGVNTDQLADPFIVESNGKTYLFGEYSKNAGYYESQVWMWVYNGTFAQLVDGV